MKPILYSRVIQIPNIGVERHTVTKIYLDMDGVLVDLNRGMLEYINNTIGNYSFQTEEIQILIDKTLKSLNYQPLTLAHMNITAALPEVFALAHKLISNNKTFWSNLFWNRGGPQLWNLLSSHCDVSLLTTPVDSDCQEGKKEWAAKQLGLSQERVLFSSHKETFANERSLLIDDLPQNILRFQQAGGKAVLYTSFFEILPLITNILF